MRSFLRHIIDSFWFTLLPFFLYYYERHVFYRFRQAWGRAILMSVKNKGKNIKIHGHCTFIKPEFLTIEDNVRIGNNCYFFCIGGIHIGHNTQFSRDVTIYAATHDTNSSLIPYDLDYVKKPVKIGHSVWIGMGAKILPGVTIGDGAIIGMGTIVSKDVPPGATVVGAASRIVNQRDMKQFNELDREEKWFAKHYPNS